jgi:nucleotide-binding universal stress UspA family protein
LERVQTALTDEILREAEGVLPTEFRGSVHRIVGTQDPKRGLLAAADEWRAELIAVGARGLGPVRQLLLGSVSNTIVRAARVPVFVARRRDEAHQQGLRLLMAWDGSKMHPQAREVLFQFTWPTETVGAVVTVMEPWLGPSAAAWLHRHPEQQAEASLVQAWMQQWDAEKQARLDSLSQYGSTLPVPFQHGERLLTEGNATDEILKAIAAQETDLLIMGARAMGPAERLLAGSTSEQVLAHAPCSVLIVRQHEVP